MRSGLALGCLVALASLGGACTTVLYKGPARPESEISVLTSRDTRIVGVDRVNVTDRSSGNSARFELLPGDHEVAIAFSRVIPGFLVTRVQSSRPIVVCVELEPGHTYRAEATVNGQRWIPRVIDLTDRTEIDPFCDDGPSAQAPVAPRPPTPVAAAPPTTASPVAEAPTPPAPDGGAPAPVAEAVAPSPPPAVPPPPVPAAVDRETPHRARAASDAVEGSTNAQLSDCRPGTGFSFFTGFGFGGSDFVKATSSNGNDESLSAGQGVIVGLGGMATPFWPSENVGFGLGVDAAFKYDSIDASNGSASIVRFPIAFSAHMLTNGSGGSHYFMLKGGVIRDFGVSYTASGFDTIDASPRGTWGPMGALGYYKRTNDSFAWDVMGFFALTNHVAPGGSINADSFGITLGFHLNL